MRRIVLGIGIVVIVFILFAPGRILWRTLTGEGGSPSGGLLTLNTKDGVRFSEANSTALSLQTSQTLFPEGSIPNGVIVAPADQWQAAVAAAPLIRWANGPLLLTDGSGAMAEEVERLQPSGINGLSNVSVVQVGLATSLDLDASTSIQATNPAELAAQVDSLVQQISGDFRQNVLLVPDDPGIAVPAAYYAAQSGDALLFGGNPLPEATRQALEQRSGQANIYVIGFAPEELSQYGSVQQINTRDATTAAVALAEYYDEATDFGWGMDYTRYFANHNFVLANPDEPHLAVAGLSLGRFGKFGPLLWVNRDSIPPATDQYLWKMRPEYFVTPAEGPFNFLWILGSPEQISIRVQGDADLSQEIEAYRFEGDGLSALEAIWVVWIIAGLVSAVWLLLHSWRQIPHMDWMMRITWVLFGLVTGPLAIWLYRYSYHRRVWMRHGNMTMWHREGLPAMIAASAMNRGFDGPLMLVISWIVTALGLPILIFRGPVFWLGNPMMLGIFIAYFGALALHWLVMHAAMFMHHEGLTYGQAVRRAFQPAFLSMTAMAVGMMGYMWWLQMANLMMEDMPEADDIMWWGTTLLAIVVGWLVALPVDAWLVNRQKQPASM